MTTTDVDVQNVFPESTVETILRTSWPVVDSLTVAMDRGKMRRQVRTCRACELRDGCLAPVPYEAPTRPDYVVIGEAPGKVEDDRGRPFVGPSGRLLRTLLGQVGLEPDDGLFCNVASCRPPGNRAPTPDEMMSCRVNLLEQVDLGQTPWVIACGATALSAIRGDLKVSKVHGWGIVWRDRFLVMPIYHPAALLRERALRAPTVEDLRLFKRAMDENRPLDLLGIQCVQCSDVYSHRDRDGVPWCSRHWAKTGRTEWAKWRRRWTDSRTDQLAF